ncbi:hypothetical protein [Streptomyces justiciae]|uniref:hypothetical protein n=1 Tax=Streptomyces justiciae TaxID=2780140 RepID=UPI00187E59E5|nr:hypothetical protein [Streptomyces justiciae]MBE8474381.1 hypothetical protein [Streptomyces justiciae]MCW8382889.1 hypothetical protein [Streptomyces justiciae]
MLTPPPASLPNPTDPTPPTYSTDLGAHTYTTGHATFTVRATHDDDNVHATRIGRQAHQDDDNVHITYARSDAHATARARRQKVLA